jgi:outer membrane autotransporter protein
MKARVTMTLAACLGSCVAGAALTAEPAESSYFEASFAFPKLDIDVSALDPTLPATHISFDENVLVARGGYMFNRNFAVEAMAAAGLSSGNISGVTLKVDSAFGVYLKGQVEVARQFELYARAGWARTTLSTNVASGTSNDNSFSYGAGAQYRFNKNWYVQGEYTSLYDKDGVTINGAAIGVGYRF